MSSKSLTVRRNTLGLALALCLAAQAGRAEALTPLAEEAHINASLMAAAIGDVVRKTCPTISPRWFTVYSKARALEAYAREKGYQEAEVKAFLKNKDEKARVRKLVEDYMRVNGVVEGDVETYCTFGRAEIAKETLAGSLLRSSE